MLGLLRRRAAARPHSLPTGSAGRHATLRAPHRGARHEDPPDAGHWLAAVDNLQRDMNMRIDAAQGEIRAGSNYEHNKKAQAELARKIGEVQADYEAQKKRRLECVMMNNRLMKDISFKNDIKGIFGFSTDKTFDQVLADSAPVPGTPQSSPEEKAAAKKAVDEIRMKKDVEKKSVATIRMENEAALARQEAELAVLGKNLKKLQKAKDKIDAALLPAEHGLQSYELQRKRLGLTKEDIGNHVDAKPLASEADLESLEKSLDMKIYGFREGRDLNQWFGEGFSEKCRTAGIDQAYALDRGREADDDADALLLERGLYGMRESADALHVELGSAVAQIDATLLGKGLDAGFKKLLEMRKKTYEEAQAYIKSEVLDVIPEEGKLPKDAESLRAFMLEHFPELEKKDRSGMPKPHAREQQGGRYTGPDAVQDNIKASILAQKEKAQKKKEAAEIASLEAELKTLEKERADLLALIDAVSNPRAKKRLEDDHKKRLDERAAGEEGGAAEEEGCRIRIPSRSRWN